MDKAVKHSTLAEGLLAEFDDPYLHAAVKMNLLVQRLILAVAGCHGRETPELTELLAAAAAMVERLVTAGRTLLDDLAARIAHADLALAPGWPSLPQAAGMIETRSAPD